MLRGCSRGRRYYLIFLQPLSLGHKVFYFLKRPRNDPDSPPHFCLVEDAPTHHTDENFKEIHEQLEPIKRNRTQSEHGFQTILGFLDRKIR